MKKMIIATQNKTFLRAKARLNVDIARDLSANFGGEKKDYLKRLNRQLRLKKHRHINSTYPKAA